MASRQPQKVAKRKRPRPLKESSRGQLNKMRSPNAVLKSAARAHFFGYSFGFAAGSVGFPFVLRILNNDASGLELYMNYWIIKLLGSFMLGLLLASVPTWIFHFSSSKAWGKVKTIAATGHYPGRGGFVVGLGAAGCLVFITHSTIELIAAVFLSVAIPPVTASWWAQSGRKLK